MRKIGWGIIGAGGIADRRTMPAILISSNAGLVAAMEVNKEFAEKIRVKYNLDKVYDNIDELLANPLVEAVYIASPVVFHKEQVIKAASAGKHILVEKPAALTSTEGKEIADFCRERGILAATGFMMRFHAYHQKMKELIDEGKLGQIVSCRAQLTCWYPEIPGAWRQKKELSGGGALMDLGVHCIDLIQYITGGNAVKVAGFTGTKTFGYEVDDSASLIFETDKGANAYVDVNFNIPDAAARCRLEFYGTRGSMLAEGTISQVEGGKLEVIASENAGGYDAKQERSDTAPMEIKAEFGNMYAKQIESFSNSILNKCKVEAALDDTLNVQRVVEAAYESSVSGRFIYI